MPWLPNRRVQGAAARTNFPKERYDVAALHALAIEEVAAHLKARQSPPIMNYSGLIKGL